MAHRERRTKIRGAMPSIVAVDETAEATSYKVEIRGHIVSLPLELRRAWTERGAKAAKEFEHYAVTGWALFKPERVTGLRQIITRARSQATYWNTQAAR